MKSKTEELDNLKKTSIEELWERDLKAIEAELDAIDEFDKEQRKEEESLRTGKRVRPCGSSTTGGRGRRGRGHSTRSHQTYDEEDSEGPNAEIEDEDEEEAPPPKKPK